MEFSLQGFEHSTVYKYGRKGVAPMLDFEAWEWTVYGRGTRTFSNGSEGHEITLRIQAENVWKPKADRYDLEWSIIVDEKPEGVKPRNRAQTYVTDSTSMPKNKAAALRQANTVLASKGVNIKIGYAAPK